MERERGGVWNQVYSPSGRHRRRERERGGEKNMGKETGPRVCCGSLAAAHWEGKVYILCAPPENERWNSPEAKRRLPQPFDCVSGHVFLLSSSSSSLRSFLSFYFFYTSASFCF